MLGDWLSGHSFRFVHQHHLVYNACWEDPRLDRQALALGPDDVVVMITSAGCNALDYLLDGPAAVHCVDLNPRQNALLELKLAGIRRLEHSDFFQLFGRGSHPNFGELYRDCLRTELSPSAQAFWDRHPGFFCGQAGRGSFYFRGTAGLFAWLINGYIDRVVRRREAVEAILEAPHVEAQRQIYERDLRDAFWRGLIRWFIRRDATLALVGVPRPQRRQVERNYAGGVAQFVEDAVEAVFARLPLADNYFWRVYLQGSYTPHCCPEYLKPENFARLRDGLIDRVHVHTGSLTAFLETRPDAVSRFVLLDHMDWLSSREDQSLRREWEAILTRATAEARVIWRSGGLAVDHIDRLTVTRHGRPEQLGDMLRYHTAWADELHAVDRVHTYGSFYIADLAC